MFKKILIANRGEIAMRIIRTCKEMGIKSVAVFAEADRYGLHVKKADEAYSLGPDTVAGYLNAHRLVNLAVATGCDALHPGYGFLSEKPELAEICERRGIRFIGPGLSTLLANFQVFIMIFAGVLFLRQRPSLQQVIAVPLALAGLGLIIGLDWDSLPGDYQLGVVFGLATAVAYASYLLTMRVVREGAEHAVPIREIGTMSLMIAVILGTSAMVEGVSLAVPTLADFGWLLCYGLFSHGLGMMFIASSLPQVSTTEAGIALLLQPTLSFVWDVVFFARPMTTIELAGAALAIGAIYLGSRKRSEQVERSRE